MTDIDWSVARIVNHSQRPDWYSPWDAGQLFEGSGSGFVVEGGLILTNAHVVSDARLLLVYLHGDPEPHPAHVHAVGHDCDLALVALDDPAPLAGRPPLHLGGLPPLRSTVETYGYPSGGRQISTTRGVVSRVELQLYSHPTNEAHLSVQTDAAINPGNSGGPVIQDGRVVGVAFQASPDLQNVGYFIPTEVIHHFLTDAASGDYQGFPSLGVRVQHLENPAARAAAGMAAGESGVQVDLVHAGSSAAGWLEPGDVLLSVDGVTVSNDGSVVLPPHPSLPATAGADLLRVDVLAVIDRHPVGATLSLRVLRRGERLELAVPLRPWPAQLRFAAQHDLSPRYFVYGGFVFVPLDREMLGTFGPEWRRTADKSILNEYLLRPYGDPSWWQREPVVLLRRLDHPVNIGAAWCQNLVIERLDGEPLQGLDDLVARVEGSTKPFHVFETANDQWIVLDRAAAGRANAEILEAYGVVADRNLSPAASVGGFVRQGGAR